MKPFGLTSFAAAALSTLFATQVTASLQSIVIKVCQLNCINQRRTQHANESSRDLTSSTRTVPNSSSAASHISKMSARTVPLLAQHPSQILSQMRLDASVTSLFSKSLAQMLSVFTLSMLLWITLHA